MTTTASCRAIVSFLTLCAAVSPAMAEGLPDDGNAPLPPAPQRPQQPDPYQPEEAPSFGSDVSVGYAASTLLGSWPDSGVAGILLARYDVFLVDREQPGPRLGLSLWGATSMAPKQHFTEDDSGRTGSFGTTSYGAMTVLRGDPEAPAAFSGGLGFGRRDLVDYYEGPLAIPTLNFEGGARLRASSLVYVDVVARADWGTTRSPTAASLHEWWNLSLMVSPGLHLR